jgi:2-keto-4-pentenoate hydratase/2-oxohepta-3-ene-1,7-dioic acid hydratase in catechol pathway
MRFVSFRRKGADSYGVAVNAGIVELKGIDPGLPDLKAAIAAGKHAELGRAACARPADFGFDEVEFLPPILHPSKVVCVGVNYPERAAEYKAKVDETKYPNIFLRTFGSMVGHRNPLIRPKVSNQLDYEGEIVLVVGTTGRYVQASEAMSHIAGVTIGNEGTIRDWTRHGARSSAGGKNFDGSGSVGPWMEDSPDVMAGPLTIKTSVNGELRQQGTTADLIFSFAAIIEYVSQYTALLPGDLIFTGTPPGAGVKFDPPRFLAPGDVLKIEVSGVGTLENSVADEVR